MIVSGVERTMLSAVVDDAEVDFFRDAIVVIADGSIGELARDCTLANLAAVEYDDNETPILFHGFVLAPIVDA